VSGERPRAYAATRCSKTVSGQPVSRLRIPKLWTAQSRHSPVRFFVIEIVHVIAMHIERRIPFFVVYRPSYLQIA
jgi:hypothetical protein